MVFRRPLLPAVTDLSLIQDFPPSLLGRVVGFVDGTDTDAEAEGVLDSEAEAAAGVEPSVIGASSVFLRLAS